MRRSEMKRSRTRPEIRSRVRRPGRRRRRRRRRRKRKIRIQSIEQRFILIGIIISCLMSTVICSVSMERQRQRKIDGDKENGHGDHDDQGHNNKMNYNKMIEIEPISNLTVEEILFQPGILQMKINWIVNVHGNGIERERGRGKGRERGRDRGRERNKGQGQGHGGEIDRGQSKIKDDDDDDDADDDNDDYVFDISILPILYPNSTGMCSKGMCEGSTNHTEIRLPTDPTLHIEPIDCKIEPNCEYNISVKIYKPIVHYQLNLIRRVQDCIFNVCSCNHADKLPNATVTMADYRRPESNEKNGTIDVTWSLPTTKKFSSSSSSSSSSSFINPLPSGIDIEMIEISIIQVNDSKETRLTFYENLHTKTSSSSSSSLSGSDAAAAAEWWRPTTTILDGHQSFDIGRQFDERIPISIKTRIRDTHQCFGLSSIYEISPKKQILKPPSSNDQTATSTSSSSSSSNENHEYYTKIIYSTTIVIIFIIAIVTILSCYIQYRLTKYKNGQAAVNGGQLTGAAAGAAAATAGATSAAAWRGVYQSVPATSIISDQTIQNEHHHQLELQQLSPSPITNQIRMQSNFQYINKDIFEARARGEADQFEVPHSCLTFGREIGKGAFGRVFIARADNLTGSAGHFHQMVAVKKLKKRPSAEELDEFLTEIITMKSVPKHPNIISLLGCCTIKQPFLMIMEYIGCGDLLKYLRDIRHKHDEMQWNGSFKGAGRRPPSLSSRHRPVAAVAAPTAAVNFPSSINQNWNFHGHSPPSKLELESPINETFHGQMLLLMNGQEQKRRPSSSSSSSSSSSAASAAAASSASSSVFMEESNSKKMSMIKMKLSTTPSRSRSVIEQQQQQSQLPQGKYLELLHSSYGHSEMMESSNQSNVSSELTSRMYQQQEEQEQQQQQQQPQLEQLLKKKRNDRIERPSVTETLYTLVNHSHGGDGRKRTRLWGDGGGFDHGAATAAADGTYEDDNENANDNGNGNSLEILLDNNELHNFAIQIARGMRHLEEQKITHRDLAARNILIDANKTLKISDFGLSRTGIYVNKRNKKVPLRWLSIEAMTDNLYSNKSDVWAYGIVLWEIGTLGAFPYPTVGNQEILNYLRSGQRLPKPDNCSEFLYRLMLDCWNARPDFRPDFNEIVKLLEPIRQKIYVDFNELAENYTFPPTIDQLPKMSMAATAVATAAGTMTTTSIVDTATTKSSSSTSPKHPTTTTTTTTTTN